ATSTHSYSSEKRLCYDLRLPTTNIFVSPFSNRCFVISPSLRTHINCNHNQVHSYVSHSSLFQNVFTSMARI
ncbi:hypothetical protein L2E82_23049, partial [Cichorium intybus]